MPYDEMYIVLIYLFLPILILWVSLSAQIRRWHDLNKSAKWMFILLIPVVGPIIACVNYLKKGVQGINMYGIHYSISDLVSSELHTDLQNKN